MNKAGGTDIPSAAGRYYIPNGGPNGGNGFPDLWHTKYEPFKMHINEIKPDTPTGLKAGQYQMGRYLKACQSCTFGTDYPDLRSISIHLQGIAEFDLKVRNVNNGVLAYTPEVDPEVIFAYGVAAAMARILAMAEEMQPLPSPQRQPAFIALAVAPISTHAVPRLSTASNPSNILQKTSLWIHPASSILTWSQE